MSLGRIVSRSCTALPQPGQPGRPARLSLGAWGLSRHCPHTPKLLRGWRSEGSREGREQTPEEGSRFLCNSQAFAVKSWLLECQSAHPTHMLLQFLTVSKPSEQSPERKKINKCRGRQKRRGKKKQNTPITHPRSHFIDISFKVLLLCLRKWVN